jgi:DNA modification methylase
MVKLLHGDCLELMKDIPDKSIDLIVIDPPYNIKKAEWDRWKSKEGYIEWCGRWILECQRVLKDNGSFYFFHNDMVQIAMLMEWIRQNTKFIFKQFIVWNKKFSGAKNEGFFQGFNEVKMLRNYQQMAEYCLFYTFQDETGLSMVFADKGCFQTIKKYLDNELDKSGYSERTIKDVLHNDMNSHYFGFSKRDKSQFALPTKEQYIKLQSTGFFRREYEDLRREYEDLRREYEDLRREYEDLRYTFNNQKTHHSVWNYEIAKKQGHITPKPVDLLENILLHSSNSGFTVLDCFMGSGSTGVACINTNRNFIGIEKDDKYFEIAKNRIYKAQEKKKELLFS